MEDEVLTAVTARQAQIATVAPIPSISNRLSVADFQKLNSETPGSKHPSEWETDFLIVSEQRKEGYRIILFTFLSVYNDN